MSTTVTSPATGSASTAAPDVPLQRQAVAISKAVHGHAKLVIMDEPTAALGVAQTEMVLSLIRRLADQGLAVLVISHNMNDVFRVADRIAVLYLGRLVGVHRTAELNQRAVVDLMTFGRCDLLPPAAPNR
jgi:ABC-type sugar transport system ATPase subunit